MPVSDLLAQTGDPIYSTGTTPILVVSTTAVFAAPFYAPRPSEPIFWTWVPPAPSLIFTLTTLYVAGMPWEITGPEVLLWQHLQPPNIALLHATVPTLYAPGAPRVVPPAEYGVWQFVPLNNLALHRQPVQLSAASKIVSQATPAISFISHLTAVLGRGTTQIKAANAQLAINSIYQSPGTFFIPRPAELQFWQPRPIPQPLILIPTNVTISLSALAAAITKIRPSVYAAASLSAQATANTESRASATYNLHLSGKSEAVTQSSAQPAGKARLAAMAKAAAVAHLPGLTTIGSLVGLFSASAAQLKSTRSQLAVKTALATSSRFMSRTNVAAPIGIVGIAARLASNSMATATATGSVIIAATSQVQSAASGAVKVVTVITSTLTANVKARGHAIGSTAMNAAASTMAIARSSLSGATKLTARATSMSPSSGTLGNVLQILMHASSSIQTSLRAAAPIGKTLLSAKSSIATSLRGNQLASLLLSAKSKLQSALRISPSATGINLIATGTVKVAAAGHYTLGLIAMIARAAFVSNSQLGRTVVPEIDDPVPVEGGGGNNPVGGGPNEITGSP